MQTIKTNTFIQFTESPPDTGRRYSVSKIEIWRENFTPISIVRLTRNTAKFIMKEFHYSMVFFHNLNTVCFENINSFSITNFFSKFFTSLLFFSRNFFKRILSSIFCLFFFANFIVLIKTFLKYFISSYKGPCLTLPALTHSMNEFRASWYFCLQTSFHPGTGVNFLYFLCLKYLHHHSVIAQS